MCVLVVCVCVHLFVCLYVCICMCRDQVPNILFEDAGDDHPVPVCILDALLKVRLFIPMVTHAQLVEELERR